MEVPQKSTGQAHERVEALIDLNHNAWRQLEEAPNQKDHPFKTCTVATITPDGLPDTRMVVLRLASKTDQKLWFHTDLRAQKVTHLHNQPEIVVLFWDDETQVQLRCRARTTIHTDDALANEHWTKLWEGSRKMYLSEHEPGSVQPKPYPGFPPEIGERLPTKEETEAGRPNFAVVECTVYEIDYLRLSRAGQIRARFQYETRDFDWLAP